jgi:SH3 domain protein
MIRKLLLMVLFTASLSVSAEAPRYAYITDEVNIPMRSDRSFNNNLIKMLTTGDKLKVIRYFDGWTQVQYGGQVGWIISRYLSVNEPAKNRLKQLKGSYATDRNNTEYQQRRDIVKLEASLNLYKKRLKYAEANLKLHKKKFEQASKKLSLYKKKDKLKAEIRLEQDKEREIEMEDLLNIVKAHYVRQIAEKVKGQWRYQGAENNWGCDVHILQDSNGNVQSVSTQSCNVAYLAKKKAFKKAIEKAVYKASPLPKAPVNSVFDREVLFHFKVN